MTPTAASASPTWDHARFERNLAALSRLQPELARRLRELPVPVSEPPGLSRRLDALEPAHGREGTPIEAWQETRQEARPPGVEPACGRDGTPTFRIRAPDGRRHWLGRTSMPSLSAPAALEHFDTGGGNALLPIVGTGFELDLLCQRLWRHCAVFAYDADPLTVKLALYVSDLAEHLSSGRLVLLTFGPIDQSLPAFLAEHPGYDFPHRMLVHPAVPKEAFERLRAASEAAASATGALRLEAARTLAAELARRPTPVVGDTPRVVLLSSDPRPGSMETVRQLTAALTELGWPVAVQAPLSPDQCHNVGRLAIVRDHQPGLILTFNSCVGRLAEFLPAGLSVASWFWPGSLVGPAVAEGHGPVTHVFGATPGTCEQLREAGVPADRIRLLEVGVDTSTYRPTTVDTVRHRRLSCDVAILADAVDCSPTAVGIKHQSQIALWEAIRASMARHAHEYTSALVDGIVAEAERSIGIRMTAEDVRQQFVQLVLQRLAGTTMVRETIARLRRAGFKIKVWGYGWDNDPEVRLLVAGPIPEPAVRNEIYQCAKAVVFPFFNADTAQGALEATASGGLAVFKKPETALAKRHPQIAAVLELLPQYAKTDGLIPQVRKATIPGRQQGSNTPSRHPKADWVLRQVREEHSLVRRCLMIRDALHQSG